MRQQSLSTSFASSLALAVVMTAGCGRLEPSNTEAVKYEPRSTKLSVTVAPVERRSISTDQEFTGDLLPRRRTRIVAEVEGVVQKIPQVGAKFNVTIDDRHYEEQQGLTYGQPVVAGELLAQLDPRDFEIELRMAEAKLAKAQADLAQLKSWERPEEIQRLTALKQEVVARHELAKRELGRMHNLVPSGVVTASEFEQASMETSTAAAMVDAAEATLASAQAGPTAEEIAVQQALVDQAKAEVQQKQYDLSKTAVRAPFNGVVTAVNVEVGERVAPGSEPLLEIMDISYLAAEIGVPEAYVGAVHVQDRALVTASGSADPVTGLVVAINELVNPETRTFQVRIAIDNTLARLKAGQFVSVRLPMNRSDEVSLVAPRRAVVLLEGQPHMFVVKDEQVFQRRVTLGFTTEDWMEILSGVEEGERVVVNDPARVSDGLGVTVLHEEARVAKDNSADFAF